MLTRKTLIDSLKANGLTGDVTLESAKAHVARLASEGVEFTDANGVAINVDAIWNAKSAIKLADDVAAVKGTASPHATIADAATDSVGPQRFSIGNANRKAYANKIKSGRAAFSDVDQAETFGAWARSTIAGQRGFEYASKKADLEIVGKAQVEFNNQLGGALVPSEFLPNLVWLTEQYGVARKIANVVPMSRDVVNVPRKTAINGMVAVTEAGTIAANDNSYSNVALTAKKYGNLFQVSRELLADSAINIADDIARSIAEAQAIAEDQAYFLGNGSGTYASQVGLIAGLPGFGGTSGAYPAGVAWASMAVTDFTTAIGRVENVNPSRLAFVCSRQFFAQVMLKLDKVANQFKDLTTGMAGVDGTFLGYPVYFSQVMPTANSANPACYFGDFMGATMLGDRRQVEIATSDQFYFNSDSLAIRGTSRFCVNIHGDGRGSTFGPIVALVGT